MKPAVLFVHSNTDVYGADFILLEVVRALSADISPTVALPGNGPLRERLEAAGIPVITTGESVLRRARLHPLRFIGFLVAVVRDTLMLRRFIKDNDVTLVYSNTAAVVAGAFAARLAGVTHLYHVHEIVLTPRWFARVLARHVVRTASVVIAVSDAVRSQLRRDSGSAGTRIEVIHNGLDPARFDSLPDSTATRRGLGAGPQDVLIGVIGRIHPWKGQEYFMRAAQLVAERAPEARFVVIGGTFAGYEWLLDRLVSLRRELGLDERLSLLPHREDVPSLMKALDIFVLPSTSPDPLPTVILEAMASARPVIATAHGGASEMVVEGITGLLVPHDDVGRLAEAMISLTHAPATRRAFGAAGHARLCTAFHRDQFISRIRTEVLALAATERIS